MESGARRMRVYRFEEPIASSLAPRGARPPRAAPPPRRRGRRWLLLGGAGVVLAVAGAVLWLGRSDAGVIPAGTTIDGVAVGGLTRVQALERVRAHGRRVVARGLVLETGGNRFAIGAEAIRLHADARPAVAQAVADPPFLERLLTRLGAGEGHAIPLRYSWNRPDLARVLEPVRQAVSTEPVSATIRAGADGAFEAQPASAGVQVDVPALHRLLADYGRTGPDIEVPTRGVAPSITTAQARQAAEQATTFAQTPHEASVDGDAKPIPQRVAIRAVRFDSGADGGIRFTLSGAVLRSYFSTVYGRREVAPRNASFAATKAGDARIIAGRNGRGVDVAALVDAWVREPGLRTATTTIGVREPDLTTEEARHMGITRVVGEFFTPYSGGARVINIARAAEILDQYIIQPGAEFSLNKALGERTEARGFVMAPMIGDGGVLKQSVGGGVSQVATTTFNAAFFAGLKLIAHTPHSFWITRYPKGREATVSWGGPELIFRNNWKAPVVILTRTDDAGITVRMLSAPLGRKVVAYEGEPYSISKAKVVKIVDKSLKPGERKIQQMPGEDGFWIKYGRRVYRDGKLISKQLWTWRYAPENGVILIGPKRGGGGADAGAAGGADGQTTGADGAATTG